MDNKSLVTGGFTLPGEAGYEELTLQLAQKWGADVIRDSDGTQLSEAIATSGYEIYSTLCLVRADNQWAKEHPDKLQQCCIMSRPVVALATTVTIDLLSGYFRQQFRINSYDEPKTWWQVFDRTTGEEVRGEDWTFDAATGFVRIHNARKWHLYTVNFFCCRIWEEISMYNHVTNDWGDREHLMPIDPMHPEAQERILAYLRRWLHEHPNTSVVRLTSMFYNFWWFWGDHPKQRFIVNDWGSYEFTVSPLAILKFQDKFGYQLKSEDFVNAGLYNTSHKVPSRKYQDWMDFINAFVVDFGRKCVGLIHAHEKKAFVFYNDHWIGLEPWGGRFKEIGFDGIIDGIFSGFETRKVAGTRDVETRELRMHPYLFPTGVNGAPSFLEGGNPTLECKTYWIDIRRALLRDCVDRIGFGGYLHLVRNHPDFIDYITELAKEFRMLRSLHENDSPYTADPKIAILTAWGQTRAWGCCGHYNRGNYYNEVMESVSGLPLDVKFISFEDIVRRGIPATIRVIINAGTVDDAWSGGEHWSNPRIIEAISEFVYEGGGLIGVGEPSALRHGCHYFQLAELLGVDREIGLTRAFNRFQFDVDGGSHFMLRDLSGAPDFGTDAGNIYVLNEKTQVLAARGRSPMIATKEFGRGRSVYFSGHRYTPENVRLLHRAIFFAARAEGQFCAWLPSNVRTECAYYPDHQKLMVINNGSDPEETEIAVPGGRNIHVGLEPYGSRIVEV
ncbi:MAG: 1,3-beta-galactosyl-N-acetylhexosamine phosphorylase [Acidobacteria bacterium]|nr:MAG: 1,3-beta-galactosyl-N-acetylhexosamine phosphorylase [Acidobacteriota bacterium]